MPVQCLASSKILTPTPLNARRGVFGEGGGHTRWVEGGGGGVNILEDARHCSVLYIRKYFVGPVHIHSGRYYSRPVLLFTFAKHFTSSKILSYELKGMLPFIDSYYTQITSSFPLLLKPAPEMGWLRGGNIVEAITFLLSSFLAPTPPISLPCYTVGLGALDEP
jgi:hypothetical protein